MQPELPGNCASFLRVKSQGPMEMSWCLTFYPESQKMLVQQSLSTDSDMAEILTNEYYRVLQSWCTELLVLPQVIHLKDFSFGALQTVQAPSLHKP